MPAIMSSAAIRELWARERESILPHLVGNSMRNIAVANPVFIATADYPSSQVHDTGDVGFEGFTFEREERHWPPQIIWRITCRGVLLESGLMDDDETAQAKHGARGEVMLGKVDAADYERRVNSLMPLRRGP